MNQSPLKNHQRNRLRSRQRKGVAAVEAVIIIPFVIVLMLGTLEVCSRIFLKESVTICAFEGVRAGLGRGTTNQAVVDRVNQMLTDRGINLNSGGKTGSVTVTPADFSEMDAMDDVTVTVKIPIKGNSRFVFDTVSIGMFENFPVTGEYVEASVTMVREFDEVNTTEDED
ncbi:MAG: TadE/TadG family type IV pilus assembly protein [Mariniblastus sp.]